jgi:hypothetical protein
MKKLLACVIVAVCVAPLSVRAGERVLDAGLGAASGGLLFGWPVAVAGGVVGYTAGPAIARSWGLSGRRRHHYRRNVSGRR